MLSALEEAIYDVLSNSTDITEVVDDRIYAGYAPEGAAMPYIVFNYVTGEDWLCGGGNNRVGTVARYLIEAYQQGESFPHQLAELIDEALNGGQWTDGDVIVDFYRLRPFSQPDNTDGREFRRSGGFYELIVRG
jgi:hypothetical protein